MNRTIHRLLLFFITVTVTVPSLVNGQTPKGKEQEITEADTFMQREDYAGALAIYNKLLEKSKFSSDEDFTLLYKRAYAFYGAGKFNEALVDINRFLAKTPDPQAKLLRAYINQELGDSEAQLKDLNEFIGTTPDNLELIRWRASVLMTMEKYADARRDIRKILAQDPNPDIQGYLGLSYYYDNQPDSALTIFDEAISSNPANAQSYIYAASLALEEETYEMALQYINKGLTAEPANTTLMFYKGIALVQDEKTEDGCRCLSKAFNAGVDDAGEYLKSFCYGVE
ncbi:MAG: tetratricopeptide repeat protein [Chryseolinea sp.]